MKTIKLIICISLLWMIGIGVNAEIYSGNCGANGDNIKWNLDTETGVLEITGSGKMMNSYHAPWYNYISYIKNVIIKNSITSIGNHAFEECSVLNSITIPNSVTSIGDYAFNGCSSLTSITIPDSVTSIESGVFSGCSSLTSITIPNSVTSIGDFAFSGCVGLTFITIPNSVTSIGLWAFHHSSNLSSIYVYWNKPLLLSYFINFNNLFSYNCYFENLSAATLYVPTGTKSKYESADVWKEFGTIKEFDIPITGIVSSVSLNKGSIDLLVEENATITATVYPSNASNPALAWSSSNENAATVDDGKVTAIGEGTATITARTVDGSDLSACCTVNVSRHSQSITWNQDLSNLTYGSELITLQAASSSGLHISYKSSDDNVATIFDMGFASYLSPRNVGTATITARQEGNNYYAPAEMTKVANVVQPDNVNGVHAVNGRYTVYTATGTKIGTYNESEFRKLIDSHKLSGGLYIINGGKIIIK